MDQSQRIEHFSHVHPLLLKDHQHKKEQVSCSCCEKPISGPSFSCNQCNYFLHKSCTELPLMVKHPLHPQHPLTLLPTPPYSAPYICDACKGIFNCFVYHCSVCKYDLDVACASTWHPDDGHNHAFISLNSLKAFVCYACGEEEGIDTWACLCSICQIWVHSSCAELPQTVIKYCHHHPLKLTYSLHHVYGFRDDITCGACDGTMSSSFAGYFCSACKFPRHLKCPETQSEETLTEDEDQQDETHASEDETHVSEDEDAENFSEDEEDDENEKHVSEDEYEEDETQEHVSEDEYEEDETHVSDDDKEDETRFSDDEQDEAHASDQSQSSEEEGRRLFSHDHLLTLMEEQSLQYADKLCNGCVQPITPPLYSCSENCGFVLHKSCAELPRTKQHRFHPHPLTLLTKVPFYDGIFRCDGCKLLSNGFVYRCDECQFDLDIICGTLMDKAKRQSHKHPLSLVKTSIARECKGCHLRSKHVLVCDVCEDFAIDCGCANLPSKAWHMYDKHPLSLMYSVDDLKQKEHKCGICKEKMSPKQWFYYCEDCDFGAHPYCVVDKCRGVKFGVTFEYDVHKHPLALVEEIRKHPACEACGERCNGWTLECGQCKCYFHREGQCFLEQVKESSMYLALSGTLRHKYAANVLAATPNVTIK